MRALPAVEFILQRNSQTRPLWEPFLEQARRPAATAAAAAAAAAATPAATVIAAACRRRRPPTRCHVRPAARALVCNLIGSTTPAQSSPPPNMSLLFDESMGMGVSGRSWASPPPGHITCGYAGGLSPANITYQLTRITQVRVLGRSVTFPSSSALFTFALRGRLGLPILQPSFFRIGRASAHAVG